jgi:hypothetical protein
MNVLTWLIEMYILSRFERSLSRFELLGITLVLRWTAQLKASCVGVILTDFAISMSLGSVATLTFLFLSIVRGPHAVTWIF